ncbi:hypothetical protein [Desulfoscipio geothermicus]|uniref:Uncharacterized protein n=1 Tax=Desulfoscipio geothermicus DSM 3669 TaxID=1121426 RepID=A0A1I6E608_9FIRM|nr:hypothetical protein [Desulfoscipio geothermicus]SFR13180.1 hypothetical protein SAMN05660706_1275 [Desulfoscipio geothermicus DSM 3669]
MAEKFLFGLPVVTWLLVVAPFTVFWFLPLVLAKIILNRQQGTGID